MLERIQRKLEQYIHKDYAYLIVCAIYMMCIYIPMYSVACLYSFIPFIFISFFTFERIRCYSYGFHLYDNISCLCFSIPIFITFSYIAQQTKDCLWIVFFICLICMRDLYNKVPLCYEDTPLDKRWYNCKPFDKLKMNREKLNVNNDYKWYRMRALAWISVSYLLSLFFFTINKDLLCSYTLWNIIMADLLLFINKD